MVYIKVTQALESNIRHHQKKSPPYKYSKKKTLNWFQSEIKWYEVLDIKERDWAPLPTLVDELPNITVFPVCLRRPRTLRPRSYHIDCDCSHGKKRDLPQDTRHCKSDCRHRNNSSSPLRPRPKGSWSWCYLSTWIRILEINLLGSCQPMASELGSCTQGAHNI